MAEAASVSINKGSSSVRFMVIAVIVYSLRPQSDSADKHRGTFSRFSPQRQHSSFIAYPFHFLAHKVRLKSLSAALRGSFRRSQLSQFSISASHPLRIRSVSSPCPYVFFTHGVRRGCEVGGSAEMGGWNWGVETAVGKYFWPSEQSLQNMCIFAER